MGTIAEYLSFTLGAKEAQKTKNKNMKLICETPGPGPGKIICGAIILLSVTQATK